ncbi:MAG TPA: hypothetical protein VM491_07710 [Burkholderiaceae bacterium]|nr:hypothetical protein [Burkholderiaceae bacterium]
MPTVPRLVPPAAAAAVFRRAAGLAAAACVAGVLVGCATARQDPNAVSALGVVESRAEGAPMPGGFSFGLGWFQMFSRGATVGIGATMPVPTQAPVAYTRYVVRLADGGRVTLQSRDPGFRIGDCVRIWYTGDVTGADPLPPRRADLEQSSECPAAPRHG